MSILLISGPPGVGKTATATAAAAAVRDRFPDAQLFLELRGPEGRPLTSDEALARLLVGLGLRENSLPEGAERRAQLYRLLLADRSALIILDDAIECDQVLPLLPGSGRSLAIVTSRRWLAGLDPDERITLRTLSLDDALSMLADLVGRNVVDAEPEAACTIVRRCGLLPAAIQIAAARVTARRGLGLGGLAVRLSTFNLLDELRFSDLEMRTRIGSAVESMESEARSTLFALAGGDGDTTFTAASVAPALGLDEPEADRRLEALVAEGMLLDEADGYQLPSVLRAYAAEQFARTRRSTATRPGPAVPRPVTTGPRHNAP